MRMNLPHLISAGCLSILLTGCGSLVQKVQTEMQDSTPHALFPRTLSQPENVSAKPDQIDRAAAEQKLKPVIKRSGKPWFGGSVSNLPNQNLPVSLTQHQFIDYGSTAVPPEVAFLRLSRLTNLPFKYEHPKKQDKIEVNVVTTETLEKGGAGTKQQASDAQIAEWAKARSTLKSDSSIQQSLEVATPAKPMESGKATKLATESTSGLLMVWSGSVASYLDWVCGQMGLTWYYDGSTVHITRLQTVTYQLFVTPGNQSISSSTSGASSLESGAGGSGASSSSGSVSTSNSISVEQFDATVKVIEQLAKTDSSSVLVNKGAGTVVVTTTGQQHVQVRQFVESANQLAAHRFSVNFDVYTVVTNENENFSFDPSRLLAKNGQSLFNFKGSNGNSTNVQSGTLTFSRVFSGEGDTALAHSVMLQSLRQSGYTVQHNPLSFVTQNAVWDTKMRANSNGFVSELKTTSSNTSPPVLTSSATVSTLVTGDIFAAQPTLMSDGAVRLNYAITLKTLQGIKNVGNSGSKDSVQLQIPEVASIVTNSVVRLTAGETLLLTGLSRRTLNTNSTRLADQAPLALGGGADGRMQVEHIVIMIRVVKI